jgi:hypothetical protein
MIRTQIQLPKTEYESLKETARHRGRSMAHCIREAIALYLGRAKAEGAGADFASVAGKFHPVSTKDLKPHDQHLVESILGRGRA